ncbi:MAG: protein kinase [Polyangiaceae bacterium]
MSAGVGSIIGARYRLEAQLGEGGMAVVWRAVHTETLRPVALKLVRSEYVRDETVRDLFVREARIAARIGACDHIVDVLDAGVDEQEKVPFMAMELLEGDPLDKLLKTSGPLPNTTVAELVEQLAEALDQAHAAGVFHRDLKPQNLFISRHKKKNKPVLKVLDFGIAKLVETVQATSTHVGTPAYSAPEQLGPAWRQIAEQRGKAIAPQISAATDVWAMGIVVYEMLTGSPSGAFWGATTLAELPVKIVLEPQPVASARAGARSALLPQGFDTWLARCLDIDATKRFPSAGAAAAVLVPTLRAQSAASFVPVPSPSAPTPQGPLPAVGSAVPIVQAPIVQAPGVQTPVAQAPHAAQWWPQPQHAQPPTPSYPPAAAPPPPQPAPPAIDPRWPAWLAQHRGELRPNPDPRPYFAWNPFVFIPAIGRVLREVRFTLRDAELLLVEVESADSVRNAFGEGQFALAFVLSRRLLYRAAIRSKQTRGLYDDVSRLFGSNVSRSMGDPHFERFFEITSPSPQEAHAALTPALRQLLVTAQFTGELEVRQGGFALHRGDAQRFDVTDLDRLADAATRIYAALAP